MALKKIDLIYLKAKTGTDSFGKDTFANATTFNARWDAKVEEVKNANGINYIQTGKVFYDPTDVTIKEGDMLSRDNLEFFPIVGITESRNSSGTRSLFTAYLGETS